MIVNNLLSTLCAEVGYGRRMRVVVVGAGAWGLPTAAELVRRDHQVTLVDRLQPWQHLVVVRAARRACGGSPTPSALRSGSADTPWRRCAASKPDSAARSTPTPDCCGGTRHRPEADRRPPSRPRRWPTPRSLPPTWPSSFPGCDPTSAMRSGFPRPAPCSRPTPSTATCGCSGRDGGRSFFGPEATSVDVPLGRRRHPGRRTRSECRRRRGVRGARHARPAAEHRPRRPAAAPSSSRSCTWAGPPTRTSATRCRACSTARASTAPASTRMPTPGVGYKIGIDDPLRELKPGDIDRTPDPDRTKAIVERADSILPSPGREVIDEVVCCWTDSPDGWFVIDRAESVVVACGDAGKGFKYSPAIGEILADLAEGGDTGPRCRRHVSSAVRGHVSDLASSWTPTSLGGAQA